MRSPVPVLVCLAALLASPATADVVADAASALDAMVVALDRDGALALGGDSVIAPRAVSHFYHSSGPVPAWTDPTTVARMLAAIEDLREDGLEPADYHGATLTALGPDLPADGVTLARRDLLLTDALYLALYHLTFGKADPGRLDEDWNVDDLYDRLDLTSSDVRDAVTAQVLAAIAGGEVAELLDRARPDVDLYAGLRAAYRRYRNLAAAGGWPSVPVGPTLRQGDRGPRVIALRERLAATGDLATDDDLADPVFDTGLAEAVIRFQTRHGLDTDGVVGKGTVAALNVPAAARADQIRVNLERARWVMKYDAGSDFVVVNIAAFEVWLVRADEIIWRARVQVGTPFNRTPVFADVMTYLEFNPTWTVPASIADRSILPAVKLDPGYLAAQGMVLLDRSGREVAADSVDWNTVSSMPYTVRQNPGPKNALGRVKFMFPNKHAVYLHDTPNRHNFGLAARAFSSGCIRVEHPLDLAALLLDDQPGWSRSRIDAVVAGGERTTVRLVEPLPVFLLYWTAFTEPGGPINFREDLYERDAVVLNELDGPVRLHRRHEPRESTN